MKDTASAITTCPDRELADLLQIAAKAALTAGNGIRELYGRTHTVTMKGTIDLVTEADLASEAAILAALTTDTPEIPVLAEESAGDHTVPGDGCIWIVDPLDGTTNFAHSFPFFAVSIALVDNGLPVAAVVYDPLRDELFLASLGGSSWLGEHRLQVSATEDLINALIGTGSPYDIHRHLDEVIADTEALLPQVRDLRIAGAAALNLASVACGRLDAYYEIGLKPWDTAAGMLLVSEAGGRVTDFQGKTFTFNRPILASNGLLHQQLTKALG
ncbi:MAG: inositol monophosphatase [Desulfobulbus propionicus]|nr:MAG: inositol monophosphatase [Desulfobulbus propionicus]